MQKKISYIKYRAMENDPRQKQPGETSMKRYYITVTDKYLELTKELLVTKKELEAIRKYNPQLTITVDYEVVGKFSNEK